MPKIDISLERRLFCTRRVIGGREIGMGGEEGCEAKKEEEKSELIYQEVTRLGR